MLLPLVLNGLSGTPSILPDGIASGTSLGVPALSVTPPGIASGSALGDPTLRILLAPGGIGSTAALGTPIVLPEAGLVLLSSGYSSSHRPTLAEFRYAGYLANGWDKLKRWDGISTSLHDAGIVGPSTAKDSWTPSPTTSAGNTTPGLHVFRYRYKDSKTGYVSNPSEERELVVASGGERLTFPIDTSGASNIIRSTDPKVDRIVVEMTLVNDSAGTWFLAAEVENSASSVVVDIPDNELEVSFLPWPDTGHNPPPVAKNVVSFKERLWLFGQVEHSVGTANVTNGSVYVTEGASDPDWRTSVLGSSSTARGDVEWFFRRSGDSKSYAVDYYDEANSRLVLKESYAGTTGTDVSYVLYSTANVLWVSTAGFPESFQPTKFLVGPAGENSGPLTAGIGVGSIMVLFTENTMTAFLWEQDPLVDGFYRQISTKHGALHQGVVAEVNGVVFSMDRKGIVRWDGGVPTRISRPIQSDFASLDFDQAEKFHVAYCPEARALRWFVIYSGESKPTKYLQYNLETGTWGTGRYLQEITASGEAPMADGLGAFLGDSKGHLWIADQGNTDGISDAYSRGTIAAGSTATTVNLSGLSLPTGFGGVAGCFAFVPTPSGGTWARISSNTATQLVLEAPGLSTYAEGLPIWIGPVPAKLKTKAFVASDIGQKFRPRSLWVEFVPVSQGKLQVRAYENLSPTAKSWSSLARNDLPSAEFPGNNSNYPATDWVVDLSESDGNVRVPVGSEFVRSLALELECWEPGFELEVSALQLDADVALEDEQ